MERKGRNASEFGGLKHRGQEEGAGIIFCGIQAGISLGEVEIPNFCASRVVGNAG